MKKFEDDGRTVVPMDLLDEGKPSFGGRGEKPKMDFLYGREARQALFAAAAAAFTVSGAKANIGITVSNANTIERILLNRFMFVLSLS